MVKRQSSKHRSSSPSSEQAQQAQQAQRTEATARSHRGARSCQPAQGLHAACAVRQASFCLHISGCQPLSKQTL